MGKSIATGPDLRLRLLWVRAAGVIGALFGLLTFREGGAVLFVDGAAQVANGVRLVSPEAVLQVRDAIRGLPSGERLTIEIWRQGQRETIEFVSPQGSPVQQFDRLTNEK